MMEKQVDKKILGFDLDGVIIDHTKSRINFAQERGWNLKPEQTHPEILKGVISVEHLKEIKYLLYDHKIFSLFSGLMKGAKKYLASVDSKGVPYFLISRRRKPEVAIKFLRYHGFWPGYFNKKNSFFLF